MDRKRKRNSGTSEADWTATRCQRLLRPIASRIAPLRKLAYITERPVKISNATSASDTLPESPAWLRRSDTKSNLKCYSSRNRGSKNANKPSTSNARQEGKLVPNGGLISLPTPFRARVLRRNTPGKTPKRGYIEDVVSTPCVEGRARNVKRLKKDPFSFAPVAMQSAELHDRQAYEKVFELHKGITDGFSLLLERTKPHPEKSQSPSTNRRGARSLFSACLRRVPDYIQAEEEWRKAIDPDDETDVCAEVYEELEDLASSSNGWPPLREVVRAHGLKLVNDIIRDKLVSTKTRAELANMPLDYGAVLDAEKLALTFAHTLPLKRPLKNTSPLFDGCLSSLAETLVFEDKRPRSLEVRLRILDSLYSSKKLHISWIATKDMTTILSRAVRSLASSSIGDADQITQFLGRVVVQTLEMREPVREPDPPNSESDATSQFLLNSILKTVDSLLTVLTAMASMTANDYNGRSLQVSDSSQTARALLQSLATTVILNYDDQESKYAQTRVSHMKIRIRMRILASALVVAIQQYSATDGVSNIGTGDLITAMNHISRISYTGCSITEEASVFISNVALCCGQSLDFDAQDILEDLTQKIVAAAEIVTDGANHVLQQITLQTALTFAALSSSRQGKTFAEKVENTMKQPGSSRAIARGVGDNAQAESRRESFRWEEGLCEWIAATPLVVPKARVSINRADQQGSPLAVRMKDDSVSNNLSQPLGFPSDDRDDLDDSGYFSNTKTPIKMASRRASALLFSSPDVLGESPLHVAPELSPNLVELPPEKTRLRLSQKDSNAQHKKSREENVPSSWSTAPPAASTRQAQGHENSQIVAAVPKSLTISQNLDIVSRKQRLLDKYDSLGRRRSKVAENARMQSNSSTTQVVNGRSNPAPSHEPEITDLSMSKPAIITPSRSSMALANDKAVSGDIDAEDYDELALSCKKPKVQKSVKVGGKVVPPPKLPRGTANGGRKSGVQKILQTACSESDDELG